jgi:hypothetical protein
MVLRRFLVIASTAVLIAVVLRWWRQRDEATATTEPPQWPPWPDTPTTRSGTETAPATADPPGSAPAWVDGSDGAAPAGYPVKLKLSSGIFHVPGGRFYERTNPDRWYATAEAAIADGYRQSKT